MDLEAQWSINNPKQYANFWEGKGLILEPNKALENVALKIN